LIEPLLSLVGGNSRIGHGGWSQRLLKTLPTFYHDSEGLDARVLLFTVGVSVLTGVLSGPRQP
jgi:hypothetical protein